MGLSNHRTRGDELRREFKQSYVPAGDEPVVEISIEGRGMGDITLLAECASAFNGVIFDCQSSEILTPTDWLAQGRFREI